LPITKILVANRSEIAIRIFRAANELGLKTVAVWAEEDRLALHRFKSDEAYQIGSGPHLEKDLGPIESYLSIDEILRVAKASGADAIHPGYGLLSESPEFVDACDAAGITFIGPRAETMRSLGNKVAARHLAESANVPVVPATEPLPEDMPTIKKMAAEVGYPIMLKASWGGGGRGMRVIRSESDLDTEVEEARREARAAFGKDEIYLEKLVERARHVEAQILGDTHGNVVHLFERDCTVQRRNQKIVERAPAPYLSDAKRKEIAEYALRIGQSTNYVGAGTIEFLMNMETEDFYFIEVNPRVQVEHTVTEEVTGIDIIKAQIHLVEGHAIGTPESGVPAQEHIKLNGHAMQCRITTEDVINRFYDPLLEKVTAWAPTSDEAIKRMDRALREFRIRGVATNLTFLENVIGHPKFLDNSYTTKFIDETPELFDQVKRQDRATKLLTYIADVSVNGHPDVRDRVKPRPGSRRPKAPYFGTPVLDGTKQRLDNDGPVAFSKWLRDQKQVLFTDTTMRDAPQSLLATRMRTYDIAHVAESYSRALPNLLSLECWGGATFDVSMRFLTEDPWERLAMIREKAPNILLQCLIRGANGVGYTNYPDNVVKFFVKQAAAGGVDLFRIFDCFNWVDNMRVSMDAVIAEDKLCEAAICYTGDMLDPKQTQYTLDYYLKLAEQLDAAGAHIIAIKDMGGLMKPNTARALFPALRQATQLPIHYHTHDTSGISAATVLAAVESGVDAVDAAMDAFSGTTSQPSIGSLVAALKGDDRDPGLDLDAIQRISLYWEAVREQYAAFESDLRSPASEVYLHEMPGGQFTNLKEQARSLGLAPRWHEVAKAYREVNDLFGDIVKVTPSSKVVGDMALMMVSQDLSIAEVADPDKDIAFPDSVVSLMKNELSQVPNGWPEALQKKVLKDEKPFVGRASAEMPPADLEGTRKAVAEDLGQEISDQDLAAYLMYPKVFTEFQNAQETYGPTSVLPTGVYYYGIKVGDEILVDIEKGKTLVVRCVARGETNEKGLVRIFFELNGQPRSIQVPDRIHGAEGNAVRAKADPDDPMQVGAPMPGVISTVNVAKGQSVAAGDVLLSIEAMKMETAIYADADGIVDDLLVSTGDQIDAKDLLVRLTS